MIDDAANVAFFLKMIVYHGTPIKDALIRKNCYVSPLLSRAAKYARYPGNGPGNELGYIYKLEVKESDVSWEDRGDCEQGQLKKDVLAEKIAVCDVQLKIEERQSPIHIKLDGTSIWANNKEIEWISVCH